MKKLIAFIVTFCLSITMLSACKSDDYTYSETRDFREYSPSFDFFPDSIGNSEVLSFGDMQCDYWSYSDDKFLVLKFNSEDDFWAEIERISALKTKYDHIEKENYLVDGYDCVFLMCSFSNGREESNEKYVNASVHETFYCISWDLVMISEEDMTIVYNLLRHDTRNFAKWGEREAYISQHFGLNLEKVAKNIS